MENKDDVPMIPQHEAETMILHLEMANRNIMRVAIALSITFAVAIVLLVVTLVGNYTSRTNEWLSTFSKFQQGNPVITEVATDVQQQSLP